MCYTVYRRKQGNKWGSIMGIHIEVRKPDDGSVEDKIRKYKNKIRIQHMMTVCLLAAMLLSTYMLVEVQTYENMHKMQEYIDHYISAVNSEISFFIPYLSLLCNII